MTKIFTRNVCFVMWPFIFRASPLSGLSPLSVFVHSFLPSPFIFPIPCAFIVPFSLGFLLSNWLFIRFLFQMFSATFGAFYFLILVKSVKTRKNRAVSMHNIHIERLAVHWQANIYPLSGHVLLSKANIELHTDRTAIDRYLVLVFFSLID